MLSALEYTCMRQWRHKAKGSLKGTSREVLWKLENDFVLFYRERTKLTSLKKSTISLFYLHHTYDLASKEGTTEFKWNSKFFELASVLYHLHSK